jgi:hypothetical protein
VHDETVSSLGVRSQLFFEGGQQTMVECKRWYRGLPVTLPVANGVRYGVRKLASSASQNRDRNTNREARWQL